MSKKQKRSWKSFHYYHICHRGDKQRCLFHEAEDFKKMCEVFKTVCTKYKVDLFAFAILDNHYHLFLHSPTLEYSKIIQSISTRYTWYYRKKYQDKKPLWQEEFSVQEVSKKNRRHILNVIRYIHLNPIKISLASSPEEYPYSSAQYYYHFPYIKAPQFLKVSSILTFFPGTQLETRNHFVQHMYVDKCFS